MIPEESPERNRVLEAYNLAHFGITMADLMKQVAETNEYLELVKKVNNEETRKICSINQNNY